MNIGPMPGDKLWFEYENYREHERYLNLSVFERSMVEQFKAEGCCLLKNAVPPDTVEAINLAVDAWEEAHIRSLMANRKPDGTFPRLIGLHEEVPAIEALFTNENTLLLQHMLFGHRRALYTTITFLQGSQQPLHRDIPVFHAVPGNFYYRIWFALEDTTPQNGTLTGVRGGHRVAAAKHESDYGFFERFGDIPAQDPEAWRAYQERLGGMYTAEGLTEEPFALSAGDALIWHPLFPHGGSDIADKRSSRRSVVLHVTVLPPFA